MISTNADPLASGEHAVLCAIGTGSAGWKRPAELAGALPGVTDQLFQVLRSLESRGLVELNDAGRGGVSLSPLGAERLGVRIAEDGTAEDGGFTWEPVRQRDGVDEPERLSGTRHTCHPPRPEDFVDPSPGPAELVELIELAELRESRERATIARVYGPEAARLDRPPPRPSILLMGHSLFAWSEDDPGQLARRRVCCRGCGNRRLRPSEYCLRCDRWGSAHTFIEDGPTERDERLAALRHARARDRVRRNRLRRRGRAKKATA
jgi:hypothetical protein